MSKELKENYRFHRVTKCIEQYRRNWWERAERMSSDRTAKIILIYQSKQESENLSSCEMFYFIIPITGINKHNSDDDDDYDNDSSENSSLCYID
jgi:hypothetical protein